MQIIRVPPGNMSYVCSIDNSTSGIDLPCLVDLGHEMRIDDLSEGVFRLERCLYLVWVTRVLNQIFFFFVILGCLPGYGRSKHP